MKLSKRLQDELKFVERSLGDSVICKRCNATLKTFAKDCTADLCDMCPGFMVIEKAKAEFNQSRGLRS